jgi:hypothetical protein
LLIPETIAVATPCDHCKQVDSDAGKKDAFSQSDYPNINFWTKEEWIDFEEKRKDSANPTNKPSVRGQTRCAQGENVAMKYIEKEDGTPISGRQAAAIREHARDLWKDFYQRGLAPPKWSNASKGTKDEYAQDMEETFKVLWFCDNHWKSHHLVTKNYPQWYKHHHCNKKMDKGEDAKPMGPSQKKKKIVINLDNNETGDCQSNTNTNTALEASDNTALPLWLNKETHNGPSTGGNSRPKPRPLKNPL